MNKNKKIWYSLIGISLVMVLIIIRIYLLPEETKENETVAVVSKARQADGKKLNAIPDSGTGLLKGIYSFPVF